MVNQTRAKDASIIEAAGPAISTAVSRHGRSPFSGSPVHSSPMHRPPTIARWPSMTTIFAMVPRDVFQQA